MLYLRNTNQIQTLDRGIKRGTQGAESTIGWKLTNSGASGSLYITNNGVPSYPPVSVTTTDSGSFPVFPNALVTTKMTGSNWPVDGPTIMTLITTGSGLTYTTSSYISSSLLENSFVAGTGGTYGITGSVSYVTASYIPGPCMTTFYKLGQFNWNYQYTQCNGTPIARVSGSGLSTGSFGPIDWNTATISGDATNKSQLFVAPYSSSFLSAAIGNGTSVTFTNPNTGSDAVGTFFLASWIPLNSPTYSYQLLPPSSSLTVCTRFPEQTFLSPGTTPGGAALGSDAYNVRLQRLYITSGSPC
jgi:hypothetical protein